MPFASLIRGVFRALTTEYKTARILNTFDFQHNTCDYFSNKSMNSKPPNILVYTGNNCPKKFNIIEINLLKCLKADNYIVYHLLPSEVDKRVWMEHSLLLVVTSDVIDSSTAASFEIYFKNFGNVLFVCSKFASSFLGNKCEEILQEECLVQTNYRDSDDTAILRGKYSYSSEGSVLCWDKKNKPLIWKVIHDKNILILSEVYLERDPNFAHSSSSYNSEKRLFLLKEILNKEFGLHVENDHFSPQLSPGFLFSDSKDEMSRMLKDLKINNISSVKSLFYQCRFRNLDEQFQLPIFFYHKDSFGPLDFDINLYFSNLHTDVFGRSVVYFPVITTTMEAAEQLSDYEGIVIVADRQISARGRGTNKWISPVGCAMFTLNLTVPLSSHLGKKLTLLQHIASLAVVHGIKSQKLYKELDLKIKWPNDIYYGKTKIGGLLVTSVIQRDLALINIGWGINVTNSSPTSCINDAIDNYNSENSCSLPHLHTEEVIAFTLSQMEFFVTNFIEYGSEKFFAYYYSYWMHSNVKVTLTSSNQQGTVIGLDEFGFLEVKTDDGKINVFQPDGNRFDIMKNLIHSKQ